MTAFHFRSVRARLIFYFCTVTGVVLAAFFILVYFQRAASIEDREFAKLAAIRDLKAAEINGWADRISDDMRMMAESNLVRQAGSALCAGGGASAPDQEALRNYLGSFLNNYDYYYEIFIVSPRSGKIVFSTTSDNIGESRLGNPYIDETLKSDDVFIRDIYFSKNLNIPTMTFSVRLHAPAGFGGDPRGILVGRIYLERSLYNLLSDATGLGRTGETLILNRQMIVLNRLRNTDRPPLALVVNDRASVASLGGSADICRCADYRGETVLAAHTFVPRLGWGLVVKQDQGEIFRSMRYTLVQLLLLFSLCMGGVFFIATTIARNISEPLTAMIEVSRKMRDGDYTARTASGRDDDFGFLAATYNAMADSIVSKLTIQKSTADIIEVLVTAYDLTGFSTSVLRKLVEVTGSSLGAFYVLSKDRSEFCHLTSIGLDAESIETFHAGRMEGQFGKALATQEITVTRNISGDATVKLRTVIGDLLPREIITIPVVVNNITVAIVSLASLGEYSAETMEILQHIRPVMNTAYSNILALEESKRLARELGEKNQLLESQKQELESQARELKLQSEMVRHQNMELERERRKVEEANRLKSEFLSNMSHELRTPLNSILALSRVILRQGENWLAEEERGYIVIIERNGEKLLSLINDILDLSKIEAGRIDLKPREINLGSMISIIVENFEQMAEGKGITLTVALPRPVPPITSDEPRVYQILQNIISNAVKFTEEGGVNVQLDTYEDEIVVTVHDTGIGIDEKELPSIFEEFRQVDGTLSRKYEGTGLGLAIAQKSAQLVGASIEVMSQPGRGSTFIVRFRREWTHDADQASVAGEEQAPAGVDAGAAAVSAEIPGPGASGALIPATGRGAFTVLMVDDDPDNLTSLAAVLESRYRLIICHDGLAAIEKAVNERPDCVLLDMAMPGLSGFDVVRQLKAIRSTARIPVIAVTALTMKGDRERVLAAGCDDYIPKPFNIEFLLHTIQQWLNRDHGDDTGN